MINESVGNQYARPQGVRLAKAASLCVNVPVRASLARACPFPSAGRPRTWSRRLRGLKRIPDFLASQHRDRHCGSLLDVSGPEFASKHLENLKSEDCLRLQTTWHQPAALKLHKCNAHALSVSARLKLQLTEVEPFAQLNKPLLRAIGWLSASCKRRTMFR